MVGNVFYHLIGYITEKVRIGPNPIDIHKCAIHYQKMWVEMYITEELTLSTSPPLQPLIPRVAKPEIFLFES